MADTYGEQGSEDYMKARIQNDFRYHPAEPETGAKHDTVREICKGAALSLVAVTPDGNEQHMAVNKLREAMFWANAAIACEPKPLVNLASAPLNPSATSKAFAPPERPR